MQTKANPTPPENTSTPIRETEVDIIKGASNTDQLLAMQANAASTTEKQTAVKPANILQVNDGTSTPSDGNIPPADELNDPATRGI